MAGRKPIYDAIIEPVKVGGTIERVKGKPITKDMALTISRRASAFFGKKLSQSTSKLTGEITLTRIK